METISILFYTDYSYISENKHLWGLTAVERFIKLKLGRLANVDIVIKNRHLDYQNGKAQSPGATLLTQSLLDSFDELWVFGALQSNPKLNLNDLTADEISVLERWMQHGGVLVTGDHSDSIGSGNCSNDHQFFLNLGGALGREIPRAGKMRVWKGPPTGCYSGPLAERDNHNTQEGKDPLALDITSFQSDGVPQLLDLVPPDDPHSLFRYYDALSQRVTEIRVFPDHMHEGKLTAPEEIEEWPAGVPRPNVVARGRDKRFPNELRQYNLVSVFDGDAVDTELGRIVADSSFHHYLNRNLVSIEARKSDLSPEPNSPLDQMAEYYANLALWLAPKTKREKIAWNLFFWAARQPDVLEEKSNPAELVGRTALAVIEEEVGKSNLYRLLGPTSNKEGSAIFELVAKFFLIDLTDEVEGRRADLLGGVIQEYHQAFDRLDLVDPGWLNSDPTSPRIVGRALSGLLQSSSRTYVQMMSLHKRATDRLAEIGHPEPDFATLTEVNNEMTDTFCAGDWDSTVKQNEDDGFFTLRDDFTGTHHHSAGPPFEVTWECKHSPGHSIKIEESHPDQAFRYVFTGDVEEDPVHGHHKTKNGKRKVKPLHIEKERSAELLPPEDPWDGEKTT